MLELYEQMSDEERAKWVPSLLVLEKEAPTEEKEAVEETIAETTEPTYVEEFVEETVEETTEPTYVEEVVEETVEETTEPTYVEAVIEEAEIPETTEVFEETEIPEETTVEERLHTGKLTARKGYIIDSPCEPNGETFNDLVIVAADIRYLVVENGVKCIRNPKGIFERGNLVETSLGPGIVVDYCERAVNERRSKGDIHIDIAVNWN